MWTESAGDTWRKLDALHVYVSARNAVALISDSARAGNRNRLNTVRSWLSRLSETGDLGRQLAEGSFALSRWVTVANVQGSELNAIITTIGEEDLFGRFWKEVVVQSAEDGGQIIREGATGFGIGLGAVAGLVLLVWALRVIR